ncbi:MAG: glycosyltransferase family 4 protein [Geitlerinemataceae cyanobacterium]
MFVKQTEGKIKVLLVIEQCNPEWASVPLVSYNFYREISKIAEVTLVTHERNQKALSKLPEVDRVVYISQNPMVSRYSKLARSLAGFKGAVNWPLYHTFMFPVYIEFNQKVYQQFKEAVANGDYDIVHALTPMMPRYPVKLIRACRQTPFLLGPVNGGVPFPPGFQEVARKENSYLNFLRSIGRFFIPGYRETYQKADRILSGSTYTLNFLKDLFSIADDRISLFYENGIPSSFLTPSKPKEKCEIINLLFIGRLVPYKCADLVIEAIDRLSLSLQQKVRLTIVGKGSEESLLKQKVSDLKLDDRVEFAGWVSQEETRNYYNRADIFCFPSIREFGGAVVLEAMACGLPCIVANNGGIGEYVTEETGFKIDPLSREYLTQELATKIEVLVENPELRHLFSANAIERARDFSWEKKAQQILTIYEEMLAKKHNIFSSIPN